MNLERKRKKRRKNVQFKQALDDRDFELDQIVSFYDLKTVDFFKHRKSHMIWK